jgi:hypothetical protein
MKSNLIPGATFAAFLILVAATTGLSQQTVAIGDANPKTNAILYLKGNGAQGLIIPIVASVGNFGEAGMVVYNSTDKRIHFHDGNSWSVVGGGSATTDLIIGNEVTGVGSNGALVLGGSGTTASPLTVGMISGTTTGQVLKWNSATSKWELGTDNTGSVALNSAQILVGNASNVATATTMSGDATLSNTGALFIATGAVNTTKIQDGTIANADIATNAAIAPSKIGQASATNGQVLKWNGTSWAPAADNSGAAVALNSAQILVGNAANVPTPTALSGDATLSNTGALTISNGVVNSAKILDATITNADIANAAAIAPSKIGQASATNGQVLKWNGTAWAPATDDAGAAVALNSAQILVGNAANVPTPTALSGDATLSNTGALTISNGVVNSAKILDATITNADIANAAAIAPSKIGQASATNGQVLKWNGTAWAPATDDGLPTALTSGQIFVGSASNTAIPVAMTGDAAITNAGAVTIANNAVTSAKILDGAVSSNDIANGTIANVDVAAGAAIDGSKINPNFVAQNVATTGTVSAGNLTVGGTATFNALTGAGVRMVTTDATGVIGSQPIPAAAFSTLNILPKGDGSGMIASQIYDDGSNIGIGTVSPAYRLDIHKSLVSPTDAHVHAYNPSTNVGDKAGLRLETGSGWAVHLNTVSSGDWLELTNNAGTAAHRWGYQSYYPGAGTAYITGTGLDLALMGGFTGIGTITPDRKLDISDNPYQLVRLNSASAGAAIEFVSATSDDWMVATWNGSLNLVHSSTNFASQSDQFRFTTTSFYPASDNTKSLGSGATRWTAVYAVNGVIQTSDQRMKNNIRDLRYGLDAVLALRPVSYSWKSDTKSKKIGLIAQEVKQIIPEVVVGDEQLGMNYGELVPVLIKAIQEQQKTIEALEEKIKNSEAQKSEHDSLKAEIAEIKRALGMQADAAK